MNMRIGIIGGGNIGLAFAKTLSRAGIAATIANSRGPDSLKEAVAALGPTIKPGTREQAAAAEIVLIAVNWSKLPQAVAGLPPWRGRIVIDANNPTPTTRSKPRCSSRSICTAAFQARWSPTW
jgi:8-hydroxy-5-deazaflavin:NADPH oxidoreductase